ncbi:MAG: 23S rRNA methyltransferase [Alphaproteobacteria bacterium CG_4_10_14_0_2_um_filter_63_37]|nr:MAG: hypothetical protein AUJ55_08330 [Proteobacteria bacterium CG1_02_64_396]PJA25346.1 MAG: 23S rRNA methyltransferase [Alphaproteobacteria bacterium CG_4_10_14_0_2_um_filter_63_37]
MAKRSLSSDQWLRRQRNDPYVHKAHKEGYRGRAAFKLIEIDDKEHLLKGGAVVVDLGCAPGGWLQVATQRMKGQGRLIGVDLLPVEPVAGAAVLQGDFSAESTWQWLEQQLEGRKVDLLLSDMAPNTSGFPDADQMRLAGLIEEVLAFGDLWLAPGGNCLVKVFEGSEIHHLIAEFKKRFRSAKSLKPPASRKESRERYLLGIDFQG